MWETIQVRVIFSVGAETQKTIKEEPKKEIKIILKWAEERKNEKLTKLYNISNGDLDFISTVLAENWALTIDRKSNTSYWRNWKQYNDVWICQISEYYHPAIVSDERFLVDWDWQAEQCRILYRGGTRFYWFDHRWKFKRILTVL